MTQIYVAGASHELERCERAIAACRALGLIVTHDWTVSVRENGPGNEAALPIGLARHCARDDLDGVRLADVLWYLAPEGKSEGSATELGYAMAVAELRGGLQIVTSGPISHRIFCSLVLGFTTDEEALAWIVRAPK